MMLGWSPQPSGFKVLTFGTTATVLAGLCALLAPAPAAAFCGFYVGSDDETRTNKYTTVVLLREGNRTVLSMQNDYRGPPEDFALVVPVPAVVQQEQVRTLDRAIFDRVDQLAAPRLVEYWEQNPCPRPDPRHGGLLGSLRGTGTGYGRGASGGSRASTVRVESQFAVGEYDIQVLSAGDSLGLEAWLQRHGYRIPDRASDALRPYVASGMKFFVAKVDAERVRFRDGQAVLSPLRVHYESPSFSLPVRLGLLNSDGSQDLVVHVLARSQRYEVANYRNVFIPTNLVVKDDVRHRFGAFYQSLLSRTLEREPGAVVTEYAWRAGSCDPCPGPALTVNDVNALGAGIGTPTPTVRRSAQATVVAQGPLHRAEVRGLLQREESALMDCYRQHDDAPRRTGYLRMEVAPHGLARRIQISGVSEPLRRCLRTRIRTIRFPTQAEATRVRGVIRFAAVTQGPSNDVSDFVLTRLHYRYGEAALGDDLVFRAAPAIGGGRGSDADGAVPERSSFNNFQARYLIRHRWTGPVACANPIYGQWGGPPGNHFPLVSPAPRATEGAPIDLDQALETPLQSRVGAPDGPDRPAPEENPVDDSSGAVLPWLAAVLVPVVFWRRRR
ncbi:MAG: DUF2330 domain-containing protein [Myxococcota bacterium]